MNREELKQKKREKMLALAKQITIVLCDQVSSMCKGDYSGVEENFIKIKLLKQQMELIKMQPLPPKGMKGGLVGKE